LFRIVIRLDVIDLLIDWLFVYLDPFKDLFIYVIRYLDIAMFAIFKLVVGLIRIIILLFIITVKWFNEIMSRFKMDLVLKH